MMTQTIATEQELLTNCAAHLHQFTLTKADRTHTLTIATHTDSFSEVYRCLLRELHETGLTDWAIASFQELTAPF